MFKLVKNFLNGNSGGVKIDWIILAAASIGLLLAILNQLSGEDKNLSDGVSIEQTE